LDAAVAEASEDSCNSASDDKIMGPACDDISTVLSEVAKFVEDSIVDVAHAEISRASTACDSPPDSLPGTPDSSPVAETHEECIAEVPAIRIVTGSGKPPHPRDPSPLSIAVDAPALTIDGVDIAGGSLSSPICAAAPPPPPPPPPTATFEARMKQTQDPTSNLDADILPDDSVKWEVP